MEFHVNWLLKLLKSSYFELFGHRIYSLFLSQEVDVKMIFTDYWKSSCFELFGDPKYGLFWAKKFMERLYLLITEKSLFWTFRKWEVWYFFEPKSWWKMVVTWSFLAFYDIPGLGKYGFLCSDTFAAQFSPDLFLPDQFIYSSLFISSCVWTDMSLFFWNKILEQGTFIIF